MRSLDVVVVPALGVRVEEYDALVAALRDHGLRGHVLDLHAHTSPGGRRGPGYAELVAGPVSDAVRAVSDDGPPLLLGHSLGGQLGLLLAAHAPGAVGGLALPAAGTVHWRDHPADRQVRLRRALRFVTAVSATTGSWPGSRLGFGGDQNGHLMREWARVGRTGRWPDVAGTPFDPTSVTVPQLLVHVPGDDDAPPPAARALVAGTSGATTEVTLEREAFRHDVHHLRWLTDPGPVAGVTARWWAGLG